MTPDLDTIIRGGTVIDGTGQKAPFPADVGVCGDRIAVVGDLENARATRAIDASGHHVCPGFIDVHVHSEIALLGGRDQFAEVRQGITTQLTAPDGFGWAGLCPERARELWTYTRFSVGDVDVEPDWPEIEAYLDLFPGRSPANVFAQVPHCAVRLGVMGWAVRPATDDELVEMARVTRAWMEAGAGVLCLGLDYQPSANADFRELVTLSKVAAEYGGLYAAHIRYHSTGRRAGWEETFELSRQADIPVHISHEHVDRESGELLEKVERQGIDLTFESYLYPAGMTHMTMMLPMEIQGGSIDEILERLEDPAVRAAALPELRRWLGRGDQTIGYTGSGRFVGETVAAVAARAKCSLEDFAYDLILEERERQALVFPWQVPADEAAATVTRTVTHPRMMVASDGIFNIPHPHPRGHGCFARVLGHFVRERGLLPIEKAVHKMSGFPARRFNIPERGEVAPGKAADLVILDPASVAAGSTFEEPLRPPRGIPWVLVNGVPVVENGAPTGELPGRMLRRGS